MSQTKIKIKVVFDEALYISFGEPDKIIFDFADQRLFISEDGIMMDFSTSRVVRSLMRQVPEEAQDT